MMVRKVNLRRHLDRHVRMTPFERALNRARPRSTNGMLPIEEIPVYVQSFSRIYHQEVAK